MPQFIVWNEARNEAVVFLEERDARTAVTDEKHDFHGYAAQSSVAANFYETYGEDEDLKVEPLFDLIAHLDRQRAFSLKTFGPGTRSKGVIDHIRKELVEIEADPTDLKEWVDLILLAFDGAWRAGWEPQQIVEGIDAKQTKNEGRNWPDWRTADPDKAIEHVRSAEASADPIRQAALRLIEAMDDAQSFEVEAGCSGEGPLVDLVNALGIKTPPNLQAWLDDSDDANEPCDRCGEHHAAGVMEDGLCPSCADDDGEA